MAQQWIKYRSRQLLLHKAIRSPDFNSPTVLTSDPWEYVDLWMRRANQSDAAFYWKQAHHFYDATQGLPATSAPLTAYYSILNATKALLLVCGIKFSDEHGVTGYTRPGPTSLTNEMVRIKTGGVLAALCSHLKEPHPADDYSLKDVLYNLPFIHRAFKLTYSSTTELFIPIKQPRFVRKSGSYEAWFAADIDGEQYQNNHTIRKLDAKFELDSGLPNQWTIRLKKRFRWYTSADKRESNLEQLAAYHQRVRRYTSYIRGTTRLWYIKRSGVVNSVPRQPIALMYSAMHRLSELARYSPISLEKHFACQHNWLLTEFIALTLDQFMDEIASEITGHDFMITGLRANW